MTLDLLQKAINEAKRELEKHPGDAPWSCVECYHNRPCTEQVILRYALSGMEEALRKKEWRPAS